MKCPEGALTLCWSCCGGLVTREQTHMTARKLEIDTTLFWFWQSGKLHSSFIFTEQQRLIKVRFFDGVGGNKKQNRWSVNILGNSYLGFRYSSEVWRSCMLAWKIHQTLPCSLCVLTFESVLCRPIARPSNTEWSERERKSMRERKGEWAWKSMWMCWPLLSRSGLAPCPCPCPCPCPWP